MADIRIEHLERDRMRAAFKLVWRCFPRQSLLERVSFFAIEDHSWPPMRRMMRWVGVADFLDFWGAIEQAKRTGLLYLRLYTSDRPNEAAAQVLYESRGLKVTAKKWRLFYNTVYRELRLDQAENNGTE